MLCNMTNTPMKLLGVENLICLVPIIAWMLCETKSQKTVAEPLVAYLCTFILLMIFYGHFLLLAFQYLGRNPDRRLWTLLPHHQIDKSK